MFMVTDKQYNRWGSEAKLKMRIAEGIAKGNKDSRQKGSPACKIVLVIVGEHPSSLEDIRLGVSMNLPIIILKGSKLCNKIIAHMNQTAIWDNPQFDEI